MQDLSPPFVKSLSDLLGDRLLQKAEALAPFSKDESAGLIPVVPQLVALPQNTQEVSQIAQLCSQYGVFLTPWGAGTGKSGGAVAVAGGLLISLSRMDKILSIDHENATATVQPGLILADFQSHVENLGFYYPPDPASAKWCSLGGNVAENAAGPSTLKYGVTRNYLLELEAVLISGEVIRCGRKTAKGVTGYDLVSLLCGSEGTLALITEITLKIIAKPRHIYTALAAFASDVAAANAVQAIRAQGLVPRALEFVDRLCIEITPQLKNIVPDAQAMLIIECDGMSQEAVFNELKEAVELAGQAGAIHTVLANDARQRREIWDARFKLSEATKKLRKFKVSEDIVVPVNKITEMVAFVASLGPRHGWYTCSFGHAGDGNLHVQILFDDEDLTKLNVVLTELFTKTIELGGTLSGEHGIGIAKKAFMHLEQSLVLRELQQRIKLAFDPHGLLNPQKIF